MNSIEQRMDQVKLATRAAMAGDLASLLQRSSQASQADQDYNQRLRETLARERFGDGWQQPAPSQGGDEVQIHIDSPSTVHYHLPATAATPAPQAQAESTAAKWGKRALLGIILLCAGGSAGVGIPWALGAFDKAAAPAAATTSQPVLGRDFVLELVPEKTGTTPKP